MGSYREPDPRARDPLELLCGEENPTAPDPRLDLVPETDRALLEAYAARGSRDLAAELGVTQGSLKIGVHRLRQKHRAVLLDWEETNHLPTS